MNADALAGTADAYEILPTYEVESPAWHQLRTKSVGASDVAAILGLSPWQTPLDIYRAKKGIPHPIDPDLAYFGHALEPVIAEWIVNRRTDDIGIILDGFSARSKAWPWLTAAPDRTTYRYDGKALVPVELKSSSAFSKASWAEGPPLFYQAQVQAQCAVLDAPYGWLAVLHGGNSPDLHRIERDDEFIEEQLVPETRRFWEEHVLAGVEPDPMSTAEAVSIWPGDPDVDAVEADDDLYALYADFMHCRREAKQASNDEARLALELQKAMGDATELRYGGLVLATWKPQAGARRLDTTLLRKDHPDLADAYTTQGAPQRRFLPKEARS